MLISVLKFLNLSKVNLGCKVGRIDLAVIPDKNENRWWIRKFIAMLLEIKS